mgnify:CR=1 FL=1
MNLIYGFFQYSAGLIFWILSKLGFYSLKVRGLENLKKVKGPLIMTPNHGCYTDSFLLLAVFPHWLYFKVLPVRAMCAEEYLNSWILGPILRTMGSYPSRRGQGMEKSLIIPDKLLKEGKTIGLYPEGRMVFSEESLGDFKRGLGELVKKNPQVPVIPVSIKGTKSHGPKPYIIPKGRVEISFGVPYTPDCHQTAEEIVVGLKEKIHQLYIN